MSGAELDRIRIDDLALRCVIGVARRERRTRQRVLISITLYADLAEAARSDRLADTVDYEELQTILRERVERSRFLLLEKLAMMVAETCLECRRVQRVKVRVQKPGALRFARAVAVEITRSQTGQNNVGNLPAAGPGRATRDRQL